MRYNKDAVCPKCGSTDIHVIWHRGYRWGCPKQDPGFFGPEHMDRYCRRCGYAWVEIPLDAPPPEPEKGCIVPPAPPPADAQGRGS